MPARHKEAEKKFEIHLYVDIIFWFYNLGNFGSTNDMIMNISPSKYLTRFLFLILVILNNFLTFSMSVEK